MTELIRLAAELGALVDALLAAYVARRDGMKDFSLRNRVPLLRTTGGPDIETTLIRQQNKLDWKYTLKQLTPLAELKEAPGILDRLGRLRASHP